VAAITLTGGGYASEIVIPAATAIPFPKHLDPARAAAVLVQGLTAYILLDQAQVKNGDVVLIAAAAGGVGSLAVQLAKARGATVIGLAAEPKAKLLKSLGADHVFDYGKSG
jgi:NADPH2:quinone reductase